MRSGSGYFWKQEPEPKHTLRRSSAQQNLRGCAVAEGKLPSLAPGLRNNNGALESREEYIFNPNVVDADMAVHLYEGDGDCYLGLRWMQCLGVA